MRPQRVDQDGEEDDRRHQDRLEIEVHPGEHQARLDRLDQRRAEDRPERRADAAEEARAAQNRGRDDVELATLAEGL